VCESRPKFEGRLLAEALAKSGIGTALITDAMMSLYVKEADAAIIGADLILSNGNVVNKVGSRLLALLCKEHKKPFYVLASKSKLSKEKIFKSKNENPDEVWTKKIKKLSISNIYFEEIEKNLISKIFTE
jgi:translation initiation factor eIF-2B subunit delta